MRLRKAALSDAPLLVAWRNADRDLFGDTAALTLAAHTAWWKGTYAYDLRDHLYVAEVNGDPAGTVGIVLRQGGEIGRVMLGRKDLARTGVMSAALRALMGAYGLESYWLRVKPGNTPAISFYQANGFHVDTVGGGWVVMRS